MVALMTTELMLDHRGVLAVNDGIVFYLTECCKASGKGSANSPTGVCCRACYMPVPAFLGAAWLVSDSAAWKAWADEFAAWTNAPDESSAAIVSRVVERVQVKARATTGYLCKLCGAESPVGIGYAGQPVVDTPAPGCPNYHEQQERKP